MSLISISGSQGSGKAQPLYSKILTPTGWKLMGDLRVGDEVLTPNGSVAKITNIFSQGIKSVYTLYTHDGASASACGDHLWKCTFAKYTKQNNKPKYIKCNEVVDTNFIINYITKNKKRKLKNWGCGISLPLIEENVSVLNTNSNNDIIPPYLMGCLLGDGGFTSGGISFTTIDPFLLDKCSSLLLNNYTFTSYDDKNINFRLIGCGRGNTHWYIERLKQLGLYNKLSHQKFIPDEYKNLSNHDKWELLKGLMDTDGTISKNGSSISFTSTSLQLARDVQELVWSVGGTANLRIRHPFYKDNQGTIIQGKTAYEVHVKHNNPIQFFSLPRKLEKCSNNHYKGHKNGPIKLKRRIVDVVYKGEEEVQCIMIDHPEHLYITDDYIVTHNSTLIQHLKEMGYNTIERKTSRSILTEWDVSLDQINSDADLTLKFQQEIIKRKYEDENAWKQVALTNQVWFTERTYADLMTYFLITLGKNNEYTDEINEYYRQCLINQQAYDRVFYLTAGFFVPVHDGVRGSNIHYSRMTDKVMLDLTQQMTISAKLTIIDTPDIDQRINIILAHSGLL